MYLFHVNKEEYIAIDEKMSIGREKGDLTFPEDEAMSTSHGTFTIKNNNLYFEDFESTNGTYVNKKEMPVLEEFEIQEFDMLLCGFQEFIFTREDDKTLDELDELYKRKVKKELLSNLHKQKLAKIESLLEEQNKLTAEAAELKAPMLAIKAKFEEKQKVFKGGMAKLEDAQKKVAAKAASVETDKNTIEIEKQKLFKEKIDVQDQLKLVETSGGDESKLQPYRDKMQKLDKMVDALNVKKEGLPGAINKMKKEIEAFKGKLNVVRSDMLKLKSEFEGKQKEISTRLGQIDKTLADNKKKLAAAQDDLDKTNA